MLAEAKAAAATAAAAIVRYDRAGVEPLFPFGHGLGYTTWCYESARATPSAVGSVAVTVTVRNTGSRSARRPARPHNHPRVAEHAEGPRPPGPSRSPS